MSFVITGYPVVIVENKNPVDSHALEHHAAQFMRCEREKLKLLGVPSNRIGGRMFRKEVWKAARTAFSWVMSRGGRTAPVPLSSP